MLKTKEHYDLIAAFEQEKTSPQTRRFDKEEKSLWVRGIIYQHGPTNELFLVYRMGYAYGKVAATA